MKTTTTSKHCWSRPTTTPGYTHVETAVDVRVAGELGALSDKGFFAQDLPKFPPIVETASEELTEAV